MLRLVKSFHAVAEKANWIAALMLLTMMLLTTADVIMRFFKRPIPGTYEMIGLFGSATIACALGYTSVAKGNIAVDLVARKLPLRIRAITDGVNATIALMLFAILTWQGLVHGSTLLRTGEVSLTVKMPIYPFAFGLAIGCSLLCLVLIGDIVRAVRTYKDITET